MAMDISNYIKNSFERDFGPIQTPTTKLEVDAISVDGNLVVSQTEQPRDVFTMSDEEWWNQDRERFERVMGYDEFADVDLTKPIPRLEPVIYMDEIPICCKRSNSFIMGNPGVKKTTLAINFALAYLKGIEGFQGLRGNNDSRKRLLWLDTEQEDFEYSWVKLRLNRCMGLPDNANDERIIVKGLIHWDNPSELQKIVDDYIWAYRPGMVVLDGIVDLVKDPNNPTDAQDAIRKSRQWAHKYNAHILTIIHTNEGTELARGHIGREAKRKYETAIICKIDEKDGTLTHCSFQKTRRKNPGEFGIRFNESLCIGEFVPLGDIPKDDALGKTPPPSKTISIKDEAEFISRLLMDGKVLERSGLIRSLMEFNPQAKQKTIENHITNFSKNGLIVDVGNYKYRLAERSWDE